MSTSKRSLIPFRSIIREIQDLKGGIGSLSRRSFEVRLPYHYRSRSHSVVLDESQYEKESIEQSNWASMPPELLTDVIKRLECSESSWPSRKHVVACAAVCSTWREITKELVQAPELSGKLTFPISLKQPGPRDAPVQCFIKRDRTTSTYNLYLGLSPKNFSRGSNSYMGKLRSNFLGTKFTMYDSQPLPHYSVALLTHFTGRTAKQVTSKASDGNYVVAHIGYELNVLGTRGPRRMQCTLLSIPASAMEARGSLPTSVEFPSVDGVMAVVPHPKSKSAVADCSTADCELVTTSPSKDRPLVLKNKAPRWHEQLQCWCLNFRGRVTVASVKNFQLVAATEPTQSISQSDYDKVLLQFGKIGKDIFTMDYRYPLSAFQAFAICLSSFDTKLACE
ncbi:hypothetical protein O6H91_02G003700 [Diphasiastrum complanatum]|uniref:Uncharacterized protein n=1 Tax=Diphasiastrum complanatum TaxID=34168 RepID=A0ACC2ECM2_DIPCM|nr:hypothetical protein O6H91_02G003700 [Diphasiastrum complanatum]